MLNTLRVSSWLLCSAQLSLWAGQRASSVGSTLFPRMPPPMLDYSVTLNEDMGALYSISAVPVRSLLAVCLSVHFLHSAAPLLGLCYSSKIRSFCSERQPTWMPYSLRNCNSALFHQFHQQTIVTVHQNGAQLSPDLQLRSRRMPQYIFFTALLINAPPPEFDKRPGFLEKASQIQKQQEQNGRRFFGSNSILWTIQLNILRMS